LNLVEAQGTVDDGLLCKYYIRQ